MRHSIWKYRLTLGAGLPKGFRDRTPAQAKAAGEKGALLRDSGRADLKLKKF